MGSDSLPLHSWKGERERKLKFSNIISSPKKAVGILLVFITLLYIFRSSQFTHNSINVTSTSSDFIDYNINPSFWAPSLSDRAGKSAYPKSYFTKEALKDNDLNPVSAVILRVTDDDESIVYAVKHLLKYPFITGIYIHNQVKSRPLTVEVTRKCGKLIYFVWH